MCSLLKHENEDGKKGVSLVRQKVKVKLVNRDRVHYGQLSKWNGVSRTCPIR